MTDAMTHAEDTTTRALPKVAWDDSQMKMSYANVVNVTATREEVALFFGTNLTWNPGDGEYKVKLTDRIIVNPHAAKRLLALLAGSLKEYENRYGKLDLEGDRRPKVA